MALPVTLLSGFLGAGKTTLLKHVLESAGELRCAVIVNDMAELNIDAALVKNAKVLQAQEELVEMQNGCICCTLREDLLRELRALAAQGRFDCVIIESTGVSEPQQVAETFFYEYDDGPVLNTVARLDCCVTVVDAAALFADIHSLEDITTRDARIRTATGRPSAATGDESDNAKEAETEEEERSVAELLLDQIEFADVLILNKTDLVPRRQRPALKALLAKLNPSARVLEASHGRIDVKLILQTNVFDMERAAATPGWLESMNSSAQRVPETLEYGIGSFVYRARRPFHPQRLYDLINDVWIVKEFVNVAEDDEDGDDEENDGDEDDGGDDGNDAEDNDAEDDDDDDDPQAQSKRMTAALAARFGNVLRAKGFIWVAGGHNDSSFWEWGLAGLILNLKVGGAWNCVLPEDAWAPADEPLSDELRASIRADFVPGVGDRRQELVFIGQDVRSETVCAALDACLLTDPEWEVYQRRLVHSGDIQADEWDETPFSMRAPALEDILAGLSASDDEDDDDDGEAAAVCPVEPETARQPFSKRRRVAK